MTMLSQMTMDWFFFLESTSMLNSISWLDCADAVTPETYRITRSS